MASNYAFSVMPSVSISRSRFERKSQHKTSFNLGDIVPIYVDEVLPGDTRSMDLAALVRMSTPIAPIMDNIYLDFFAFFVPNRLVWDHWKEFMGENNTSAGIPAASYDVPAATQANNSNATEYLKSLGCYFGIPFHAFEYDANPVDLNALPFRGYYLIYNEWFRNQNVIAPIAVYKGDNDQVLVSRTIGDITYKADVCLPLMKAAKLPDYFTKALPYAQKGDAVQIPLSASAPIVGEWEFLGEGYGPVMHTIDRGYSFGDSESTLSGVVYSGNSLSVGGEVGETSSVTRSNLVADLSKVAGTINELRYAFQLQKFLEKDALYGSRYWEILAAHFGVKAPDASLQRPEYLGGFRMNINIDQVLSTAGYSNTSSTTVGAPGANSVTGKKASLFTKSFTEHGFLFIMAVARHDQTYTQGINRMWLRKDRFDYYWPVFANLGAQAVLRNEVYYATEDVSPDDVFGYQEAWAEYRYKPSIATGLMNPVITGSLDYWTLANDFESTPTLGQQFIEQGRTGLSRALVTGSTGPDFIGDFYFRDIAVRPMPTFSIPGLADHH